MLQTANTGQVLHISLSMNIKGKKGGMMNVTQLSGTFSYIRKGSTPTTKV